MIDPVQLVVHAVADADLAPLEHFHLAQQHRRVHAQVELRVARRLDHLRRADDTRHIAMLAAVRPGAGTQVDHVATMAPHGRLR